jgi:hypothetical protein
MIGKAFWLAIYSFNFIYFVKGAYLGSSVFFLGHGPSQAVWTLIAALTGKMLYHEIRKATTS